MNGCYVCAAHHDHGGVDEIMCAFASVSERSTKLHAKSFVLMCCWMPFLHHLFRVFFFLLFFLFQKWFPSTNFTSICNVYSELGYGLILTTKSFTSTIFSWLCNFWGAKLCAIVSWLNVRFFSDIINFQLNDAWSNKNARFGVTIKHIKSRSQTMEKAAKKQSVCECG